MARAIAGVSSSAVLAKNARVTSLSCTGNSYRPTFDSASASDVIALSSRGTDEWPPRFVARSVKFVVIFSARLHAVEERLAVAQRAAAALVDARCPRRRSSRWFCSSQSTPLDGAALLVGGERDDDVAVGDVASRCFMRSRLATKIEAIALSSAVPRP